MRKDRWKGYMVLEEGEGGRNPYEIFYGLHVSDESGMCLFVNDCLVATFCDSALILFHI